MVNTNGTSGGSSNTISHANSGVLAIKLLHNLMYIVVFHTNLIRVNQEQHLFGFLQIILYHILAHRKVNIDS